jgi:hypothetical protein
LPNLFILPIFYNSSIGFCGLFLSQLTDDIFHHQNTKEEKEGFTTRFARDTESPENLIAQNYWAKHLVEKPSQLIFSTKARPIDPNASTLAASPNGGP